MTAWIAIAAVGALAAGVVFVEAKLMQAPRALDPEYGEKQDAIQERAVSRKGDA